MKNRKYWQQAAGDTDRNYVEICLKWDVILNGPGDKGKLPECQNAYDELTPKKRTDLRRFSEDIEDGDVVALRIGTNQRFGVGVVRGHYEWSDFFGDIDGWRLQHVRRVKWLWKKPKSFKTFTLKQGDTTQSLDSRAVLDWIESLSLDIEGNHALDKLPESDDRDVDFEEVADFLFDQGISSHSIETLSKEIGELIRIANWYDRFDHPPSETETVTYLAIPLLRALGWTPQKMAMEWNKIDIALFSHLPRNDQNLSVVVEAKKKGSSCLTAVSQAQSYAQAQGKESCKRLVVTDGLRYGVYVKRKKLFKLYAYFNLTRLRNAYPVYDCLGAKDAFQAMAPEWTSRTLNSKA